MLSDLALALMMVLTFWFFGEIDHVRDFPQGFLLQATSFPIACVQGECLLDRMKRSFDYAHGL